MPLSLELLTRSLGTSPLHHTCYLTSSLTVAYTVGAIALWLIWEAHDKVLFQKGCPHPLTYIYCIQRLLHSSLDSASCIEVTNFWLPPDMGMLMIKYWFGWTLDHSLFGAIVCDDSWYVLSFTYVCFTASSAFEGVFLPYDVFSLLEARVWIGIAIEVDCLLQVNLLLGCLFAVLWWSSALERCRTTYYWSSVSLCTFLVIVTVLLKIWPVILR